MSSGTFAVLGLFSDAHKIVDAAKQIRPRKLGRLEAYTPYPVHGLDRAIGLAPSRLGRLVMFMGVLGAGLALLFEGWVSAVDYPLVTGGKALFSWQAFVPVIFEVTVLFATFTAGLAMLFVFNKLPFFGHPVLHSKAIKDITRDKLALSIEATVPPSTPKPPARPCLKTGPNQSRSCRSPPGIAPSAWSACCAPSRPSRGLRDRGRRRLRREKVVPIVPPMFHMHDQPKLNAFRASAFFPTAAACGQRSRARWRAVICRRLSPPRKRQEPCSAIHCLSPKRSPNAGARYLATTAPSATVRWATACRCFRAPTAANPAISCPTKYAHVRKDTM